MPRHDGGMVARSAILTATLFPVSGPALAAPASRHGAIPGSVPIDRIIENITKRLDENLRDDHAFYVLGRAHGLAYETANQNILAWGENSWRGLEPASAGWQERRWDRDEKDEPTEEELETHLREAISNLSRAIELNPHRGEYHLALASILEAGRDGAPRCEQHPLAPSGVDATEYRDMVDAYLRGEEDARGPWGLRTYLYQTTPWDWDQDAVAPRDAIVALLLREAEGDGDRARAARDLLMEDWDNQITERYYTAMCLALPGEGQTDTQPIWGSLGDYVAYEAARHYVAIVEARGARPDEHIRLPTAKATVEAFRTLPEPGGITPVIFGLEPRRALADLVDVDAAVTFDLDGLSRGASWSWVRPETAILVWDPGQTGEITSGRQLFGNASWWLMFRDGYEALDAIDNDRDGSLSGTELAGIAAWFDRNQDGVSDAGEVVPIEDLGVVRLACRADTIDRGCLAASGGVELADGTVLASVDWVAEPIFGGQADAPPSPATCADTPASQERLFGFTLPHVPFE